MTAADHDLLTSMLTVLCNRPEAPQPWALLEHVGVPVSWQRAGDGKGHHYTPKETRVAEHALGWTFKRGIETRPYSYSNIALALVFYLPDLRRKDADNLEKLVMDAATKANAWHDDVQVTRKLVYLELDAQNPRTLIGLAPAWSTLDRTIPMKQRRAPSLPLRQVTLAGR